MTRDGVTKGQEASGRAFTPWPPPLCSQPDPRDETVLLDQDPSLSWDPRCHPIEGMALSVLEGPIVVLSQDHRPFALAQGILSSHSLPLGAEAGQKGRGQETQTQMLIQMLWTNLCPWGQTLSPRARERAPGQGTPGTSQVGDTGQPQPCVTHLVPNSHEWGQNQPMLWPWWACCWGNSSYR